MAQWGNLILSSMKAHTTPTPPPPPPPPPRHRPRPVLVLLHHHHHNNNNNSNSRDVERTHVGGPVSSSHGGGNSVSSFEVEPTCLWSGMGLRAHAPSAVGTGAPMGEKLNEPLAYLQTRVCKESTRCAMSEKRVRNRGEAGKERTFACKERERRSSGGGGGGGGGGLLGNEVTHAYADGMICRLPLAYCSD
jgi:hypothetical protein